MKDIQTLIDNQEYTQAAQLAIYRGTTYETRSLFGNVERFNQEYTDAYELLLLADAKEDFDVYCRYLDYRQPLARNFYIDRRKYLKKINDTITRMFFPKHGEVSPDVLRVKMPTRTGKTEDVGNRAAFWVQGNFPGGETLHAVGGGRLRDQIHEKRTAFIREYWDRHVDVFPDAKVVKQSKDLASVWFRESEYADISTVTVGGSVEGHVQVTNLLVLDDLVASTEINSVSRLESIYEEDILNAIMRRYVGGKIFLIGTPIPTLTGMDDPLDAFYKNRQSANYICEEISIPALNEKMESNYTYRKFINNEGDFILTLDTEHFMKERRAAYAGGNEIAIARFETIYQMEPMRIGAMRFSNIKTYNEEPNAKYKEINKLDPADKGEDAAVLMHCRIYDGDPNVYVHDIFYDKRPMDTQENSGYLNDMANFIIRNNIHVLSYEENLGGTLLGDKLIELCYEQGHRLECEPYRELKNKVQRINDNAMEVIDKARFWENPPTKQYEKAVDEIRGWSENAKHDDAPECITDVIIHLKSKPKRKNKVHLSKNPVL